MKSQKENVVYCEDCEHFTEPKLHLHETCWRKRKYLKSDYYVYRSYTKVLENCIMINKDGKCKSFTEKNIIDRIIKWIINSF